MRYLLAVLLASVALAADITGTATFSWTAPTTNTDGTPITNLAGYKIYYGTESGVYNDSLDVPNAATTTSDLDLTLTTPAGSNEVTMFAVMAAYNTAGQEGPFTPELSKTFVTFVPPNPPGGVNITISVNISCTSAQTGVDCQVQVNP